MVIMTQNRELVNFDNISRISILEIDGEFCLAADKNVSNELDDNPIIELGFFDTWRRANQILQSIYRAYSLFCLYRDSEPEYKKDVMTAMNGLDLNYNIIEIPRKEEKKNENID